MPHQSKINFLEQLQHKYGRVKKLPKSSSLFEIGEGACRIYIRYSRKHDRNQAFYGLRKIDLQQLDGMNSVICFLSDSIEEEPILIPYDEFEGLFSLCEVGSDGQIKASIFRQKNGTELYISKQGRFNVEGFIGWENFVLLIDKNKLINIPNFNHSQIQTMIGAIGIDRGFDIWIPTKDRISLDFQLVKKFVCQNELPERYEKIMSVIREIDVIWLKSGSSDLSAMFEVEESTPIYSGLLRFNDFYLLERTIKPKFSIVSRDERRDAFSRQINRETFKRSGLSELCNFLEYKDVYGWFKRTTKT